MTIQIHEKYFLCQIYGCHRCQHLVLPSVVCHRNPNFAKLKFIENNSKYEELFNLAADSAYGPEKFKIKKRENSYYHACHLDAAEFPYCMGLGKLQK